MTLEDALRIGGFGDPSNYEGDWIPMTEPMLLKFARAIEADAIERCAKVCEGMPYRTTRGEFANAILALVGGGDSAALSPNPSAVAETVGSEMCSVCHAVKDGWYCKGSHAPAPADGEGMTNKTSKARTFRITVKGSRISQTVEAIHEDQAWHKFAKQFEQHEKPARRDYTIRAAASIAQSMNQETPGRKSP